MLRSKFESSLCWCINLLGSTFEASANEDVACAVCASRCIPPGGSGSVDFCLAWDMPVIQFGHGVRKYYRWVLPMVTVMIDSDFSICQAM